jgi:hypothetical protein
MQAQTKLTQEGRITVALTRLGAARRERLDTADFDAFVAGLIEFPVDDVERVCAELGRIAPEEFQPRFPPLHILREQCFRLAEHRRAKKLALKPANLDQLYPPMSPERMAELRREIEAGVRRHSMGLAKRESRS